MNLTPGTRLGPYEITAPLGAGGMGEVFRATDSRLGRDVAVKVLPKHLSANPEVCARFEREAKTVSSLNHPHICTLFDVGREADTDYLVMELVEGETLAQRLEKGALPVADVLELGGQIADALDQAHRAGVIHRDLKPGNVMLTKSGAKLMDFGLARATGMTGPGSGSGVTVAALTQSPTVAQPLTAEGTIVGTFLYMAPEQLEGSEADARSDLWALGCVLYEMATGKRAFEGKSPASIISSIMGSQPAPISQLAPLAPPGLERLVQACLAKDPAERLQSAHDIRMQLAWLAEGGSQAGVPAPVAARRRSRERLAWILAAVGMIAVVALAVLLAAPSFFLPGSRTTEDPGRVVRFEVTAPPGTRMSGGIGHVISPEGTALLWPCADSEGRPRRWIRRLDSLESSALPPMVSGACFWSPDGASIGFINDDKLRTMSIDGGVPRTVCEAVSYRGASWGAEYIVFAGGQGPIFKVPVTGGIPEAVTALDESRGETAHRFPYFLPDGETFLYVALPGKHRVLEVYAGHVDGREPVFVTNSLISPVYASGHLIFQRGRRLLAQVFDPDALALSGKPVDLGPAPTLWEGAGATKVSASRNGTLAYLTPEDPSTRLVWKDPTSENSIEDLGTLDLEPGAYKEVEFSPDGHHVALVLHERSGESRHGQVVSRRRLDRLLHRCRRALEHLQEAVSRRRRRGARRHRAGPVQESAGLVTGREVPVVQRARCGDEHGSVVRARRRIRRTAPLPGGNLPRGHGPILSRWPLGRLRVVGVRRAQRLYRRVSRPRPKASGLHRRWVEPFVDAGRNGNPIHNSRPGAVRSVGADRAAAPHGDSRGIGHDRCRYPRRGPRSGRTGSRDQARFGGPRCQCDRGPELVPAARQGESLIRNDSRNGLLPLAARGEDDLEPQPASHLHAARRRARGRLRRSPKSGAKLMDFGLARAERGTLRQCDCLGNQRA
jgi:hypothetical protein